MVRESDNFAMLHVVCPFSAAAWVCTDSWPIKQNSSQVSGVKNTERKISKSKSEKLSWPFCSHLGLISSFGSLPGGGGGAHHQVSV